MMQKKFRKLIYVFLVPNIAFANAAIPVVAFTFVEMFTLLIPIVIIEANLYQSRLKLGWKQSLWGTFLANLATTFIGLPLAWILYFIPSILALLGIGYIFPELLKTYSVLAELFKGVFGAVLLPYLGAPSKTAETDMFFSSFIAQAIMLFLAFYVSVWIENCILRKLYKEIDQSDLKQIVRLANIRSYLLLFVLLIIGLLFFVM
ncbi:hypothetical protein ABMA79_07705 [Halobacteriovorax sp. HFRX-2_2]|uniref:hypothetical protein n=1 Tax=unclassified Halobacteriovorax TaxID=2639665 RepID=UPI003711890B